MVKFFCDICDKEVDSEYSLEPIKIKTTDNVGGIIKENKYCACEWCRNKINHYILGIKAESKKDPYDNAKNKPKYKFKVGETVKYKTGHVSYVVSNVRKIKTGYGFRYCYDLERTFAGCTKRNYKITGILESKLEEVK